MLLLLWVFLVVLQVGLLNDRMDLIPSDFPWKWYTTPPDDSLQSNTSTSGTTTEATASDAQQDSNDSANTSNSSKRLSCAVGLTPDIEDAHAAATGKTSHYIDPVSGYQVSSLLAEENSFAFQTFIQLYVPLSSFIKSIILFP
jgi:hypothetical protein